jgi:predicted transglutaminase-like cysteine proteinase
VGVFNMLKILLVASICSFTFGDIFTLTKQEKIYIKSLPNKRVIAKRFGNFYKFIKKSKDFSLEKKLLRTNFFINRIISKHDEKGNDSWATPKEFLINGYGDCEDYAISKYFTLVKLGIPKNKLFLSVVKVRGSVGFHMVLFYIDKNNIPLILDNLSWKILPLQKRKNLEFKYAFNDRFSYIIRDDILIKEKDIFGNNIKRGEINLFKKISDTTRSILKR